MSWAWRRAIGVLALLGLLAALNPQPLAAQQQVKDENERFKDTEVRVIRPKYFNKAGRFELGAMLNAIMNESFIYTFLASGLATYHFTESIGLEMTAAYGFNVDKEDKRVLFDGFDIRTKIFRTTYAVGADLQWTPMYGKWQLPSGRLIYFDTYLAFGGGMTGITWKYSDFCTAPSGSNANAKPVPEDKTVPYPTIMVGLGQRYFIDKKTALKWDIRSNFMMYNTADSSCDPSSGESGSSTNNNIVLQLGASKFF